MKAALNFPRQMFSRVLISNAYRQVSPNRGLGRSARWRVCALLATAPEMDDLFASQPTTGATPRTLVDCDLEEADLSGLDLTCWRFERTVWQGCRGLFA